MLRILLSRRNCQELLESSPKGSNVQKAEEELNKLMFIVAMPKSISCAMLFRWGRERLSPF